MVMQMSYASISAALNVALIAAAVWSAWIVWRLTVRDRSPRNSPIMAVLKALGSNILIVIGLVSAAHATAMLSLGADLNHYFLTYAAVIAAYALCVMAASLAPVLRARSYRRLKFFSAIFAPALIAALHLLVHSAWMDCWSIDSRHPICSFFADRPGLEG